MSELDARPSLETKRRRDELAEEYLGSLRRAVRRDLGMGIDNPRGMERLGQEVASPNWGNLDPNREAEPIIDEGGGAPADIARDEPTFYPNWEHLGDNGVAIIDEGGGAGPDRIDGPSF